MDHDTKTTLIVIILLIVALSTLAIFIRRNETRTDNLVMPQANTNATSTPHSPTITNMQTLSTTTPEHISTATITTNKGTIEVEFSSTTPKTVQNFATLAAKGFYDGTRFHRIIQGFMIQGGDPTSKDLSMKDVWGRGGPGYRFDDELTGNEQYTLGTLAMANAGPDTNGSQFFIVTANPGYPLPASYTVFGRVTKGIETALLIEKLETDAADRPLEDVIIEKIEVR
jgi:cyclophilin family peptidyl-prolyl cis-trans isomerase